MNSNSPAMQRAMQLSQRAVKWNVPVLLVGEAGAGKEWLARAIHCASSHPEATFVKLNCAETDPSTLSAHFAAARGGNLLLQDIERAPGAVQTCLLTLMEQNRHNPVPGQNAPPPQTRVLATTVHEPGWLVSQQILRQDLYCRISPMTIAIPPLRERREDIPALVDHFLTLFGDHYQIDGERLVEPSVMKDLIEYSWPGNVDQLERCIHQSLLSSDSARIDFDLASERERWKIGESDNQGRWNSQATCAAPVHHSDGMFHPKNFGNPGSSVSNDGHASASNLEELARQLVRQGIRAADVAREELYPFIINQVEKELIAQVLAECDQVQTKTASRLGINRNTLHKKVREHNLDAVSEG